MASYEENFKIIIFTAHNLSVIVIKISHKWIKKKWKLFLNQFVFLLQSSCGLFLKIEVPSLQKSELKGHETLSCYGAYTPKNGNFVSF
jgi:hypothetical protein